LATGREHPGGTPRGARRHAEIADDLAEAEHTHRDADEPMPSVSSGTSKLLARHAGNHVGVHLAEQEPKQDHRDRF